MPSSVSWVCTQRQTTCRRRCRRAPVRNERRDLRRNSSIGIAGPRSTWAWSSRSSFSGVVVPLTAIAASSSVSIDAGFGARWLRALDLVAGDHRAEVAPAGPDDLEEVDDEEQQDADRHREVDEAGTLVAAEQQRQRVELGRLVDRESAHDEDRRPSPARRCTPSAGRRCSGPAAALRRRRCRSCSTTSCASCGDRRSGRMWRHSRVAAR